MCLFAETQTLVHTDRTNRSRAMQCLLVALNSNIIRAGNVLVVDTVEDSITCHQPLVIIITYSYEHLTDYLPL